MSTGNLLCPHPVTVGVCVCQLLDVYIKLREI